MIERQRTRNIMVENSELYCHACDKYVQFRLDFQMNGQHVIKCPNCGHEHYRYIDNGRISDRRWGSSNPQNAYSHQATTLSYTSNSTIAVSGSGSTISWTYGSYGTSTT